MPKNFVYLKDLPFDYLEEKGYDFALTDPYKEHESFFDKIKQNSLPDLENPSLENPSVPPIVIEFLKDMVVNKYYDTNEFSSGNLELSQASWFYLQARARLDNKMKTNYVKLLKVNKSIYDIVKTDVPSDLRVTDNPFSLDAFINSNDEKNSQFLYKKPLSTSNHVHDVIKQQKYYNEVSIDPIKYDDLAFKILSDTLSGRINYTTPFNPSHIRKTLKKATLQSVKSIEIDSHISWVRKALTEKYFNLSDKKDALNIFNERILRKNMLNLLTQKNTNVYRVESFFSSDYEFGSKKVVIPKTFSQNSLCSVCVSDSSKIEKVELNSGTYTIFLREYTPFSVNILYHENDIAFTLESLFSSRHFSIEKYVFSNSNSWTIPVCNIIDGYFLSYPKDGFIKETVSNGKLTIHFSKSVSGSVFLLNNAKNSLGRKNIRLTNFNVDSVLPTVDILKDKFELWIP